MIRTAISTRGQRGRLLLRLSVTQAIVAHAAQGRTVAGRKFLMAVFMMTMYASSSALAAVVVSVRTAWNSSDSNPVSITAMKMAGRFMLALAGRDEAVYGSTTDLSL